MKRHIIILICSLMPISSSFAQTVDIIEVCNTAPLPPPVRERIENRTFPSIYQAWGDVSGLDHLTWEQRSALHDLSWGPFFWITSNWGINVTEREPNWGIATALTVQNAPQTRQRFLTQNPNHVFVAMIRLHSHTDIDAFPPDSDFWLRDANGEILRNQLGEYLINILKPEVQDLLIKRILAIEQCGFYDGVFFDGFDRNAASFVGRPLHSVTNEEIIIAHQNILRTVRSQSHDDFLIIVNAADSKPTAYTEFINGIWMERVGIFADYPVVDDIRAGLQESESLLSWAQKNLLAPQITCLHGAGTDREPLDGPNNRRWTRVFTTLSLTHSDGYVTYNTDHGNWWYPFWDANLGHPVSRKAQPYQNIEGLFIRKFTNGWAVYNRSGVAHTITLSALATPVSDRGDNAASLTHLLPDLDGEIYLTTKSFADVNGDGNVNVLDLIQVANGLGKSAPDPNGDGNVNILDLVFVVQQFSH